MGNKQLGALGENIACKFLEQKGYRILGRNYTKEISAVQKGEIDIIAKNKGVICFVEVKTSEKSRFNTGLAPELRVDFRKQRQIIKLSQIWLGEKRIPLDSPWQMDVVSVIIDPQTQTPQISHFENAFC